MIAPSIDPRRQDAALRPQPSRDGADYWPTPASLIGALIAHVLPTLPAGPVWECAAGDGRLAAAMRDARRHWRARWLADSTGHPRWAFSWVLWRAGHDGPPITLRLRERAA